MHMKILQGVLAAALFSLTTVAVAQTAPTLTVSVSSPTAITVGSAERVATVSLAATSAVTLSQLPLSVGLSDPMVLSNCNLVDQSGVSVTAAHSFSINNSSQVVATFAAPISVGNTVLSLVCDIPATTPNGSAVAVSIFPKNIVASSTLGTVSVVSPSMMDGGTTGGIAAITSSTHVALGGSTQPPGTPNTGAGGSASIIWITLAAALSAMIGSSIYLLKRRS
jgi:hypothetical protein